MAEKPRPSGEYKVIRVESQPYLEADQNFVDQRPFLDIPNVVGSNFFKDPQDLASIAAFLWFTMMTKKVTT